MLSVNDESDDHRMGGRCVVVMDSEERRRRIAARRWQRSVETGANARDLRVFCGADSEKVELPQQMKVLISREVIRELRKVDSD